MSKDIGDNLDWARQLGCPPSALTDDVKKILNHGIMNFVWDEISSVIQPVEDVVESRKNLLLSRLQTQAPVPAIQHLNKIKFIQSERALIKSQIDKTENECMATSDSLDEKGLKIAKLKNEQEKIKIKTGALKLKHKQINKELKSCTDLISKCNKLLPGSKHEIDEPSVNHCLTLVGLVSSRQDKHEAFKQIHEILGPVAVPELWDILLRKRMQDTEKFTRLQLGLENSDKSRSFDQIWKIGLATIESQIISAVLEAIMHSEKSNENIDNGTVLINKIMVNDSDDLLTWIMLNMEVAQQLSKCRTFQLYLEYFKNYNNERNHLSERESELMSDIYNICLQLDDYVTAIKNSSSSVKSGGQFLIKIKDKISGELAMIDALNSEDSSSCIEISLVSEITEFHKNTDVNALNKVMLLDKVGAYRYASACMSNILLVTPCITSAIPVFTSPLYHLINCLRNIMTNNLLKQKLEQINLEYANQHMISIKDSALDSSKENDIFELLDKIKYKNGLCQREIKNLEKLYDDWATQPVQEAMSVVDDTVNRLTYEEWVKRYSSLLFLMARNR
ncbi:uncharacterized protein LOC123262108 [Cotesia glomerata]|uniref:Uncharacterized protein n=1 Tax=Cotesia glomerata TaxID=32391 RepID=A0AAV7IEY1_COTGL|nr:uncharacterized protein LOC123262108 [Cotesia glomerata]KAH0550810.1 hypothetical protein KQX54_020896 [Cotesia glomerata]